MIYLFASFLTKELNPAPVSLVICDVQGRHDPLWAHCGWQREWQPLPVKAVIRTGFWEKLLFESHCIVPAITSGRKADSKIRRWWCWAYFREGSQQTSQCHLHLEQQSSIWLLSFFLSFFTLHWILPKLHYILCAAKDRLSVFKSKQNQPKQKRGKDLRIMRRQQQVGRWKTLFWWAKFGEMLAKAVL